MKISTRELVLLLATLAVALFGVTAILARPKVDDWKALRQEQRELQAEIDRDQLLIDSRSRWEETFGEIRGNLPNFPANKRVDIHWMSIMDSIASKHGVAISKRQAGDEKQVGDVFELPIEVREWEGSLEGIVGFMYDLQEEGAMLDVRQLLIKPNDKKVLRGRFTLYCAYTREGTRKQPEPDAGTGG